MAVLKDLIVHGRSRFVNGAQFNTINAESIGANEGIFNKLIATTLDAKEATIEDLTATNAIVTGLLDVQGQMQTNSWTNSNIATIDGSFYICPTISSEATVTTSGTTQTSNNKFLYNGSAVILTGSWATTNSLYLNTAATNWTLYSKVMLTGEVLIGTEWTPIGTIRGILTGINTSNGTITIGSLSTNITPGSDGTINSAPMILSLVTANTTYNARKLKVSLYEYNTAGTSSGATNLIGIMMTTAGTHNFTYLDIYNGLNSKTSYTSTVDNTTKATEPMVRIGNLNGLPNIVNGSTDATTKPSGWGIYTTNGFFKGKIVANGGKIAGWNISDTALFNGNTGINTTTTGAYLGYATNNTGLNISGGTAATTITIANSNFTKSINNTSYNNLRVAIGSNFGMDSSGNIYANGANIANISADNISTGTLNADRIGATSITAGKLNVSTLSAITADMGTITAGVIKHETVGGTNGIWFSAATDTSSNVTVGTSGARKDWRLLINNKFGVTTGGVLYATGASISSAIEATSFIAKYSGGTTGAQLTATGLEVFDENSDSVGKFGSSIRLGSTTGINMRLSDNTADYGCIGIYDGSNTAGYILGKIIQGNRNITIGANTYTATTVNDNYSINLSPDGVYLTYSPNYFLSIDNTNGAQLYGGLHINSGGLEVVAGATELSNSLTVNSSITASSSIITGAHIRPNNTTDTHNCGTSDYPWNYVYAKYVWMGTGSGGTNHGIYSSKMDGWLIHSDSETGTQRIYLGYNTSGLRICPHRTSTNGSNGLYLGDTTYTWNKYYGYSADSIGSDRKFKDNICSIDYAKELIMGLKPVEYYLKDSDYNRKHMGFIAQEVAEVGKKINQNLSVYEANYKDESKGKYHGEQVDDNELTWGLAYTELIAPLVQVVQGQQHEIDQLKKEIIQLKNK